MVPVVYAALRDSFPWSAAATSGVFSLGGLTSALRAPQLGRGLGIMLGPVIGGLLFDLQGNYVVAFILAVALVCVAIGCLWGASLAGGSRRTSPEGGRV
jgi:MFS family permease